MKRLSIPRVIRYISYKCKMTMSFNYKRKNILNLSNSSWLLTLKLRTDSKKLRTNSMKLDKTIIIKSSIIGNKKMNNKGHKNWGIKSKSPTLTNSTIWNHNRWTHPWSATIHNPLIIDKHTKPSPITSLILINWNNTQIINYNANHNIIRMKKNNNNNK